EGSRVGGRSCFAAVPARRRCRARDAACRRHVGSHHEDDGPYAEKMNRQILLKSRPDGAPSAANFEAVNAPMPTVGDGGVLRQTKFLSLDPYMRGRMSDAPSYAAPVEVGATMCGHTISEVIESRSPAFRKGDIVLGYDGWQQFGISEGKELRKL